MGRLILLSTPIGNLGDLTPRARSALEQGKLFAVEDTRTFKDLLRLLGIPLEGKTIDSFHDHSGAHKMERFLEALDAGEEVYLASEAGSPMVSDPAFPLVRAALERGHEIDTYPGPSAVLAALELSGLPPQPFHFVGFLPRGAKEREDLLGECAHWRGTCIFFEAPTRVKDTLEILARAWPEARLAVGRELTKKFQTVHRFRSGDWAQEQEKLMEKGEFVIVAHREASGGSVQNDESKRMAQEYLERPSDKLLSKLLGGILGIPSKEVYSALTRPR